METLKVTLIQSDVLWEQPAANLENYNQLLKGVGKTDVIVFPEMFTTGFTLHAETMKETMDGTTIQWMKNLAVQKKAAVTGTLIVEAEGRYYNRCIWISPEGKIEYYDKRHLFTFAGETKYYSSGQQRLIVEHMGWRFCPLICYDLRFPVWSRNKDEYDVLLYMANWPAARHHAWKNLIVARAIENQAYCIGVNRVGTDGPGNSYRGDSALVDPKGFATFLGPAAKVETFRLSFSELKRFRKVFPVLSDADEFTLGK